MTPNRPEAGNMKMNEELIEAAIEESDGLWVDDEFRINGKDLMNLCRAVSLLAAIPAAPSPAQDERETLTVSGKPFTAVFMNLTREEVAAISEHPKWSAGSWSHALDDRDAARAALQAAPAAESVAQTQSGASCVKCGYAGAPSKANAALGWNQCGLCGRLQ